MAKLTGQEVIIYIDGKPIAGATVVAFPTGLEFPAKKPVEEPIITSRQIAPNAELINLKINTKKL